MKYEGAFEDGQHHGYGTMTWPDGQSYVGEWYHNQIEGQGTMVFADKRKYIGMFKDGKRHGWGKMEQPYRYGFHEGQQHDGTSIYEGVWVNNKMECYGTLTFPDKRKYIGTFKQDKFHGWGKLEQADGKVYDGEWDNGKKHGYALYGIKGKKKFEKWENGHRIHTASLD